MPRKRKTDKEEGAAPVPGQLRCAIYTRKSIEKGLDQQFNSLDAQFEVCQRCIHHHASDGWVLTGTYVDAAVSGTTVEREQLTKLRDAVKRHEIDCVVVYKLDRLSRDLGDFTGLMKEFSDNGVNFVSATQALENRTPEGKFTMNMMAAVADFEAAMIRTRLRDKYNEAKAKGYWVAGKAPFGYIHQKKAGLKVHKGEAITVRRIFELFNQGKSYKEMIELLNKEQLFFRVTQGNTEPTPWNSAILLRILTNPVYKGFLRYKERDKEGIKEGDKEGRKEGIKEGRKEELVKEGLVKGQHTALVSEEEWAKAEEGVQRLKTQVTRKSHNIEYPLKGILYCGCCGGPYTGTYTIKNKVIKRYYVCQSTKGPYAKGCKDSVTFPADEIEGFLKKYLLNFRNDAQLLAALMEQMPTEDAEHIADILYSIDVALETATPQELASIFRAVFKQVKVNKNGGQFDITIQDF